VDEHFPHSSHQTDLAHHHTQKYLHPSFTNQSTFEKESNTATYQYHANEKKKTDQITISLNQDNSTITCTDFCKPDLKQYQ